MTEDDGLKIPLGTKITRWLIIVLAIALLLFGLSFIFV